MLIKRKNIRIPSDNGWVELIPSLQKTLSEIDNPYINGTEGFFILESSVDEDSGKILKLYKERDKVEKFIRGLKEGFEIGPVRYWTKWAVIGIFIVCFPHKYFLINLTLILAKKPVVKNVKLLKKIPDKYLTLTIVYPQK